MDFVAAAPAGRIAVRDLLIRRWSRADAPALHAAITESYDHLRPWVSWVARPSTLSDQDAFIDLMIEQWDTGQTLSYGISDRSETRLLGGAGIYEPTGTCAGDIAYWVHADHTGQGTALICAAALTRLALSLPGVERVEIHCDQANTRSATVARRLGYNLDGLQPDKRDAPAKSGIRMIWAMTTADPKSRGGR